MNSLDRPLTRNVRADKVPTDMHTYEANGGYQSLHTNIGKRSPTDTQSMVNGL